MPTARLRTPAGVLTGLGGSLWLRALWMLPISVCELEWDRPSKYGLGGGDRECVVLWHTPTEPSRVERRAGPTLEGHSTGEDTAGLRASQQTCAPKPPPPGGWPEAPDTWRPDGWGTWAPRARLQELKVKLTRGRGAGSLQRLVMKPHGCGTVRLDRSARRRDEARDAIPPPRTGPGGRGLALRHGFQWGQRGSDRHQLSEADLPPLKAERGQGPTVLALKVEGSWAERREAGPLTRACSRPSRGRKLGAKSAVTRWSGLCRGRGQRRCCHGGPICCEGHLPWGGSRRGGSLLWGGHTVGGQSAVCGGVCPRGGPHHGGEICCGGVSAQGGSRRGGVPPWGRLPWGGNLLLGGVCPGGVPPWGGVCPGGVPL